MVGDGVGKIGCNCCTDEGDGIDRNSHVLCSHSVCVSETVDQGRVEVREG